MFTTPARRAATIAVSCPTTRASFSLAFSDFRSSVSTVRAAACTYKRLKGTTATTNDATTEPPNALGRNHVPLKDTTWLTHHSITTTPTSEDNKIHVPSDVYLLDINKTSTQDITRSLDTLEPDMIFLPKCRQMIQPLFCHSPDDFSISSLGYHTHEKDNTQEPLHLNLLLDWMNPLVSRHDATLLAPVFDYVMPFSSPTTIHRPLPLLVLGDRPFHITLARLADLYGTTDTNNPTALVDYNPILQQQQQQQQDAPLFSHDEWRILVEERNKFMFCKILQVSQVVKPNQVIVLLSPNNNLSQVKNLSALMRHYEMTGTRVSPEQELARLVESKAFPLPANDTDSIVTTVSCLNVFRKE